MKLLSATMMVRKTLLPAARYSLLATRFTASGQTSVDLTHSKAYASSPDSTQIGPIVGSAKLAALSGRRAAMHFFLQSLRTTRF